MSFCFRRLYATLPKPPHPSSLSARSESTPLQVRRRRLRKSLAAAPRQVPSTPSPSSPLSPSEKERYLRLKRLGALIRADNGFREPTEEEWLAKLNEKRTRIRGARIHQVEHPETGEKVAVEDVVGHRIYLPNIVFRMMRNHTPPGQPYNPWEVTFRVPNSLTKLDIRSYLYAVYGVKCTYIRTDNYFKRLYSRKKTSMARMLRLRAYKRAVVGLLEPFYYPEAPEDMDLQERQKREKWIEDKFQTKKTTERLRNRYRGLMKGGPRAMNSYRPWNLVGPRGTILKAVIARRQAREQVVHDGAQVLLGRRDPSEGASIS